MTEDDRRSARLKLKESLTGCIAAPVAASVLSVHQRRSEAHRSSMPGWTNRQEQIEVGQRSCWPVGEKGSEGSSPWCTVIGQSYRSTLGPACLGKTDPVGRVRNRRGCRGPKPCPESRD